MTWIASATSPPRGRLDGQVDVLHPEPMRARRLAHTLVTDREGLGKVVLTPTD